MSWHSSDSCCLLLPAPLPCRARAGLGAPPGPAPTSEPAQVNSLYLLGWDEVPWYYPSPQGPEIRAMQRHPLNHRQNLAAQNKYMEYILREGLIPELRAAP
jgi:hypothetical protein